MFANTSLGYGAFRPCRVIFPQREGESEVGWRKKRERDRGKEKERGGRDEEGISLMRTQRVERPAFLASSAKCLSRAEVIAKLLLTILLRVYISLRTSLAQRLICRWPVNRKACVCV